MPLRVTLKHAAVLCVAVVFCSIIPFFLPASLIPGATCPRLNGALASSAKPGSGANHEHEPRPEALSGGEIASLVAWAAKLGGYMRPTGRPHVYPITAGEIRRSVCMNFSCSAVAFFNPLTDAIFVDDRLQLREDVVAQSFLVHEMVHYLQRLNGKIGDGDGGTLQPCQERMALEIEAYRIQNRFLAAMGSMERVMGGAMLARLC